jgi:hypothetical protein
MFLSKDDLKLSYGVDMEIGQAYVDRKVPVGNRYWAKRLLYITPMPGYVFMPIFSDLAYRCGIPKNLLLSETYLGLAERIMHSAGGLEAREISWQEHIAECDALALSCLANPDFLDDLRHYFAGKPAPSGLSYGTAFRSLNRADTYLFSLASIPFDRATHQKLLDAWYALITYFLVMDDLEDIRSDFEHQEENAVLDAGLTESGARRIIAMIDQSYEKMLLVNPVMANRIDHKRASIDVRSIIRSFLKEQDSAKDDHRPPKT